MTSPPNLAEQDFRLVRARLTRTLWVWGVGSVAVGGFASAVAAQGEGSARAAGLGRQLVAWGAIDALLARLGRRSETKPVPDPQRARTGLARLLWFNAGLDVAYVAGGVALLRRGRVAGRDVRGDGLGIVVQGGFLFLLDTITALRLRRTTAL